jgi:Protein of unknown function (DUF1194)
MVVREAGACALITMISLAKDRLAMDKRATRVGSARFNMMSALARKVTTVWCAIAAALVPAQAQPVAVELVLALDASASMDRAEFALQIKGLASAFRDDGVLQAIKDLGPTGVAIAVTQWGGDSEAKLIIPFTHIRSSRDAKAFGFRISRARRAFLASSTSIATAITHGTGQLEANAFQGDRRVIDVSGDGVHNGESDLRAARELALASGVVVNGLPIDADAVGLSGYFRERVIVGTDAFIEPASDFDDYARAIREKLIRELRPIGS